MIDKIGFEEKFTSVSANNNALTFPIFGDVINDGENNLIVCDIQKIDGKDYVLLCEEKSMKLALYEITESFTPFIDSS